jgi:hypothetical protein
MQERAEELVFTKKLSDYSSAMRRDNTCMRMHKSAAQQLAEAEKDCADSESRLARGAQAGGCCRGVGASRCYGGFFF